MRKFSVPFAVLFSLLVVLPAFAAPPGPDDLVINEVMQNPSAVADSNGEWFEVKNVSGATLDLDGCVVSDADTDAFTIAANTQIAADEYFVFCVNDTSAENGGLPSCYDWGASNDFTLGNSGDEIIITCGTDEIDRIEYDGGPVWPDPTGGSMTYNVPAAPSDPSNNLGTNWYDAADPPQSSTYGDGDYGTPGAVNHDWMDGQSGRPNAVSFSSLSAASPMLGLTAAAMLAGGLVVLRKRR
jgi:hypothetical protein